MPPARTLFTLAFLIGLTRSSLIAQGAPQREPASSAKQDDSGAKVVISKFLSSQKSADGEGSAGQHVIADLDGDGRSDIVLLWDLLGPTYSSPKMTIFLDQGMAYRSVTADLNGQTQNLTVKGPMILVDTLTLGAKDPRCCPTAKKQLRFLWSGGKLTEQK